MMKFVIRVHLSAPNTRSGKKSKTFSKIVEHRTVPRVGEGVHIDPLEDFYCVQSVGHFVLGSDFHPESMIELDIPVDVRRLEFKEKVQRFRKEGWSPDYEE